MRTILSATAAGIGILVLTCCLGVEMPWYGWTAVGAGAVWLLLRHHADSGDPLDLPPWGRL